MSERAAVSSNRPSLDLIPWPPKAARAAIIRSGTRSALVWALTRLREGADPLALVPEAARHGIDIAGLPAVAVLSV